MCASHLFQVLINTSTWDTFPPWRASVPHKHHAECDTPQHWDKMTLKLQWALNRPCTLEDVQQHADFHFQWDYVSAWAQSAACHALIRSSTQSWGSQLHLTHTSHTGTKRSETHVDHEFKGLAKSWNITKKSRGKNHISYLNQLNQSVNELWPIQHQSKAKHLLRHSVQSEEKQLILQSSRGQQWSEKNSL